MSSNVKFYIRGFIAIGGMALFGAGLLAQKILSNFIFITFMIIGGGLLGLAIYWWYKDFQQGK